MGLLDLRSRRGESIADRYAEGLKIGERQAEQDQLGVMRQFQAADIVRRLVEQRIKLSPEGLRALGNITNLDNELDQDDVALAIRGGFLDQALDARNHQARIRSLYLEQANRRELHAFALQDAERQARHDANTLEIETLRLQEQQAKTVTRGLITEPLDFTRLDQQTESTLVNMLDLSRGWDKEKQQFEKDDMQAKFRAAYIAAQDESSRDPNTGALLPQGARRPLSIPEIRRIAQLHGLPLNKNVPFTTPEGQVKIGGGAGTTGGGSVDAKTPPAPPSQTDVKAAYEAALSAAHQEAGRPLTMEELLAIKARFYGTNRGNFSKE